MKKLFLTLAVAAFTATVVSAQSVPANNFHNPEIGTYDRVTHHGPYLTGKFFDNTFLGIAGGVNIYNYKHAGSKKPGLGDRMGVSVEANLGKWITPSFGIRVGYTGTTTKAFQNLVPGKKDELRELTTQYFHGDVMLNLFNSIGGYNEARIWDPILFAGAGYARAHVKDKKVLNSHKMAAAFGLLNNFQLGHRVDLTLEGRYMFVDRTFDGVFAGSKIDKILSVTAGLSLKFGPRGGFKRPVYQAPVDVTGYENRIKVLEGDVARDRATIGRLERELEAARHRPATVEKVDTPVEITTYFEVGKSTVHQNEFANLETIAHVMKANPERKFHVTGYADMGTGNKALNQRLSETRAKNVADVLVTKFGVTRSQLVVSGAGGVNKHPHVPYLDRVVITK